MVRLIRSAGASQLVVLVPRRLDAMPQSARRARFLERSKRPTRARRCECLLVMDVAQCVCVDRCVGFAAQQ